MNYQVENWRRRNWRKDTRHDSSEMKQTLFGQWVVLRRWERSRALQGQSLEHPCDSYKAGLEILNAVEKRRAKRGYSGL